MSNIWAKFQWGHRKRAGEPNTGMVVKIGDFRQICRSIPETVQDRELLGTYM